MLSVKGVTTIVLCDFGITLNCVIIDNLEFDLSLGTDFLLQAMAEIDVPNGTVRLYGRHVKVKSKQMMGGLITSIIEMYKNE